eukprot:1199234-Pleurochrysis_carterae.AAC.1
MWTDKETDRRHARHCEDGAGIDGSEGKSVLICREARSRLLQSRIYFSAKSLSFSQHRAYSSAKLGWSCSQISTQFRKAVPILPQGPSRSACICVSACSGAVAAVDAFSAGIHAQALWQT